MLNGALPTYAYFDYRSNLYQLTGIEPLVPEEEIPEIVAAGLSSLTVTNLTRVNIFESRLPKAGAEKNLMAKESYFVYEMALIYSLALVIFGCEEKACRWLSKSKDSFDGLTPVQLLDSENGAARITTMLIQIAEGYAA